MAKKTGKRTWMNRHVNDPWVQRSKKDGYRSRASYKLLEIDDRHRLLKPGRVVVDLGAAPGGWSQVAADRVKPNGWVVALDLLPIEPLEGVQMIQADFEEATGLATLLAALPEGRADLVLSDLSPNISGVRVADQARSMGLAELALELAQEILRPGGALVVKVFHGAGFDAWVAAARPLFGDLRIRKPEASRAESREVYAVAEDFRPVART